MKESTGQKWIKWIDWGRLLVSVLGLFVILSFSLLDMQLDLDYLLSNVVALYVFLMGMKTFILGKNTMLAWFYLFFSAMMLIAVNMIHLRFG